MSSSDLCIGGPTLAAQAIRAGLVDEIQLFVHPTTLGGARSVISVFPKDCPIKLNLLAGRRFGEGWLYLHYQIVP